MQLLLDKFAQAVRLCCQGTGDGERMANAASEAKRLEKELKALGASDQQIIDAANRYLDPAVGIVAGDGGYYPRLQPDGSDPLNP